jgi:hypothetical protein
MSTRKRSKHVHFKEGSPEFRLFEEVKADLMENTQTEEEERHAKRKVRSLKSRIKKYFDMKEGYGESNRNQTMTNTRRNTRAFTMSGIRRKRTPTKQEIASKNAEKMTNHLERRRKWRTRISKANYGKPLEDTFLLR